MATEKDVYEIDTSQAVRSLKEVEEETKKATEEQKKLSDFLKEDLEKSLLSAQAQYDLLKGAIKGVIDFGKESVHAYLEQQEAVTRLQNAIKNAGGDVGTLSVRFQEQAGALEEVTGRSSESIMGIQSLLLSMRVAPTEVQRFTAAILDLSAATGKDAVAAANLLARANAEGKDELKKFAIEVDDADFKARGFVSVIEQIEKRMGGAAAAVPELVRETRALSAAWDDFVKGVGQGLTTLLSGSGITEKIILSLKALTEEITGNMATQNLAIANQHAEAQQVLEEYNTWMGMAKQAEEDYDAHLKRTGEDFGPARDAAKLYEEQLAALAKRYRELTGINLGDHGKEAGFTDLGTISPVDPQKMAEADKKKWAEQDRLRGIALKKAYDDNAKNVEAQRKLDEEEYKNAISNLTATIDADYELKERAAKDAEDLKKRENEAIEQLNKEQEQQELQHQQELANIRKQAFAGMEGYLNQIGGVLGSWLEQSLQSNTKYTKAVLDLRAKEIMAQDGIKDATVARARAEAEMAADAKASQAKQLAAVLANISGQATMKAIFETAEGIAALASYQYDAAGEHFAAAVAYGLVAGASGGISTAISSSRGMTKEEKASLSAAENAQKERAAREQKQMAQFAPGAAQSQVNVYNLGITGQTEAAQGRELERVREEYARTKTGSG